MADYFVASGGSNTSPYETWAKAATSLQTALTAATGDGDRVIIQYDGVPSGDAEVAVDTTYTFGGNIALIASTNSGTSTVTPTAMGTANWIGNSTTNRSVSLAGAFRVYMYGITIRLAGTASDTITLVSSADGHQECESCVFRMDSTSSNGALKIGATNNSGYVRLKNCDVTFGNTSQNIAVAAALDIEGGTIAASGTVPTNVFVPSSNTAGEVRIEGCDLSGITTAIVGSHSAVHRTFYLSNCKLGSGVTPLETQTPANKGSARLYMYDCAVGDEHYHLQYHDAFGSLTTDTAIYANDGAQYDGTNYCSWKIVTTANCSYYTPFVTPWFDVYHSGTSAVTPSIEILRDGSTTAYQDDEVWGEWAYKGTTGSTQTTLVNDRKALVDAAANQAAGVGTSGWTGDTGAWSGKLAAASTITPAEIGHIRGRVFVGEPSITVYVDPQTRLA